jgi:hypothetical protein
VDGHPPDRGPTDGAFLRPFLDAAAQAGARAGAPGRPGPDGPVPPPANPGPPADKVAGVRPYSLTRGRVASSDPRVRLETMVMAVAGSLGRVGPQAQEHRSLLAHAWEPRSVVELAVAAGLPVGVAVVLVGDLAREGLVELSAPAVAPRDDVTLIRRIIDGVAAL